MGNIRSTARGYLDKGLEAVKGLAGRAADAVARYSPTYKSALSARQETGAERDRYAGREAGLRERVSRFEKQVVGMERFIKGMEDDTKRRLAEVDSAYQQILDERGAEIEAYKREIAEGRFRLEAINSHASTLERVLEVQKNGMGHMKLEKRKAGRRVIDLIRMGEELVIRAVEDGYSPITGETRGRYAFIDRHGNLAALSRRAQAVIFGYHPGTLNYNSLISPEVARSLVDIKEEKVLDVLPIRIREGNTEIKDVRISPLCAGDIYLGTIVDFQTIGLFEKWRADVRRRAEEAGKILKDTKERLGGRQGDLGLI